MTISDSKRKSLIIMAILTGLWILFCALFFGIERLLPEGYSYRSLFRLATVGFLILSGIILTLLWLIRISGAIWARTKIPAFFRVIFCLFFIGLWIVFCLFCGIVALFYGLDTDTEVKEKNGLIYMRRDNFLGPPDFYYEKAVNPLLRRSLSATEERNHPVPSPQPERNESNLTSEEPSPTPSEPTTFPDGSSPQEQTDSSNSSSTQEQTDSSNSSSPQEPTPSEQPSGKDDPLYPEFMAVHNFLDEKNELSAASQTPSLSFSAKGTPYMIFEPGSGTDNDGQKRLVYDRPSANGTCDLFVYYLYGADSSVSILEFYAVNTQTLAVIPGEKTDWSDSGSKEYQKATGEP